MTVVRGLSWAHTRGHAPMVATSCAWTDRHPDIRFEWEPRSLAEFAAGGLAAYVGEYDLVALDYPLVGEAVQQGWLQPLDDVLSAAELRALAVSSIGPTFGSYVHAGRSWAAPLDAAALTSAHRPDLLEAAGLAVPHTFDEMVALARSTGRVGVPLTVFGAAALFFSLCAQDGGQLFADGALAERDVVIRALTRLADLAAALPPACLDEGPVALLGRLASDDHLCYVGYAYGYSVYARRGYFPHRLTFTAPPPLVAGSSARATLGGVGLALLARAPVAQAAVDYLRWITSPGCQRGLFTTSGGQPAATVAWDDRALDALNGGFFAATRESLIASYVRPNAAWFAPFQVAAGRLLQEHVRRRRPAEHTAADLDAALAREWRCRHGE